MAPKSNAAYILPLKIKSHQAVLRFLPKGKHRNCRYFSLSYDTSELWASKSFSIIFFPIAERWEEDKPEGPECCLYGSLGSPSSVLQCAAIWQARSPERPVTENGCSDWTALAAVATLASPPLSATCLQPIRFTSRPNKSFTSRVKYFDSLGLTKMTLV